LDLHSRDTTERRLVRDEATHEAGGSFIVVDTGPWIFGKKVMIPAGVIRDIDPDTETIFVDLTKEEIKDAPEFDETTYPRPDLSGRARPLLLRPRRRQIPAWASDPIHSLIGRGLLWRGLGRLGTRTSPDRCVVGPVTKKR
jgi:hypothetical protein